MGRLLTTFKDKTFEPSMKSFFQLFTDDTSTASQIYDSLLYVRGINAGSLAKNQENDDDVSTVEDYDTYMPVRFFNVKSFSDGTTPAASTHTFFSVYNRAEYAGPDGQNMYDLWADYNISKLSGAGFITNSIGGAYNYGLDAGTGNDQTLAGVYGAINYAKTKPTGSNRTVTFSIGSRDWVEINKSDLTATFVYPTISEFAQVTGSVGTLAMHKFDLDYTEGNVTNAYFIWADESTLPTPSGEKFFIKSNIPWPTSLASSFTNTGAVTFGSTLSVSGTATFNSDVSLQDNDKLKIGTGNDLQIYHDGSNSYIEAAGNSSAGNLIIRHKDDGRDLIFQGDNGDGDSSSTTYFFLNSSMAVTGNPDVYTQFPDNSRLTFGNSANVNSLDLEIYHDSGSNIKAGSDGLNIESLGGLIIENNTTGDITIEQKRNDGDIIFKCDSGTGGSAEYFRVDGGTEEIKISKKMQFNDNVKAVFGTGEDLDIFHDGTDSTIDNAVGDLIISNNADDKNIIFKCENGSGGITEYFRVDGTNEVNKFSKHAQFLDSIEAKFGNGGDLRIYHDGSNSRINETGTGNLIIQATNYQLLKDDGGEFIMQGIADAEVSLYHNGSKKFETTSTGATVTGSLEVAGGDVETSTASKGLILKSPNGTRFRVTVDNSGNLSTASL
tara:strand:+ start:2721 stop:4715 length:1995 start_codon:yes stop_codon:yes gene_type:complete